MAVGRKLMLMTMKRYSNLLRLSSGRSAGQLLCLLSSRHSCSCVVCCACCYYCCRFGFVAKYCVANDGNATSILVIVIVASAVLHCCVNAKILRRVTVERGCRKQKNNVLCPSGVALPPSADKDCWTQSEITKRTLESLLHCCGCCCFCCIDICFAFN